jgi:hypothetical protein
MYFPRNWEFGSALSKFRNFGGGAEPPKLPRYAIGQRHDQTALTPGKRPPTHTQENGLLQYTLIYSEGKFYQYIVYLLAFDYLNLQQERALFVCKLQFIMCRKC